ncbi:MAG: FG-GAP repeat domain-containing protein, partial [Aureliella sp.]
MSRRAKQFVAGVLVASVLIAVGFLIWKQPWKTSGDRISPELFDRAVEVLATTENGREFRQAISGWSELLQARPDDRDLLLNQAVTVLKWIANTNSVLAGGSVTDPEEQRALAQELQDAYAEADRVLKKLALTPQADDSDRSLQALLESGLLEARARVLPYPEDIELRKAAAQKLLDALKKTPGQPLLAARLFDLAQELQADWPEVVPQTTEAGLKAWEAEPRNLYLLVRTGENLLASNDSRIEELVEESVDLAQPLLPMLPSARQLRPEQLAEATRAAVEAGDWNLVQRQLRGWFNILRGSSAFRADNRLVNPDILALLNTSFLERWREMLPEKPNREPRPTVDVSTSELAGAMPEYESSSDDRVQPLVAWYDFDVDRDFDILAVHGKTLRITPWQGEGPEGKAIDVELPIAAHGLCVADLWAVDAPQRPHISATMVKDGKIIPVDSNSHDTLQEVILWNDDRAVVVTRGSEADAKHAVLDEVDGLKDLAGLEQMVPLDLDSDGDLDLAALCQGGLKLLQNNGNRTFLDVTQYSILGPEGWTPSRLVACDFDRDLDIDLVACAEDAPHWAVYENILHSQFRFRALDIEQWKTDRPLIDAAVAEIDGNASWDWCAISKDALIDVLTRTTAPGLTVAQAQHERAEVVPGRDFAALGMADFNLDGHIDACVAGNSGLELYWCNGSSFDVKPQVLLEGQAARKVEIQDADRDGRLELLSLVDGRVQLIRTRPADGASQHYIEARVRGISDVNGGGRINHYAVGSVLELWSDGHYQARVIDSPVTHFGLSTPTADNLRIIFNNGLTQNAL